jgi:hypothetical protein
MAEDRTEPREYTWRQRWPWTEIFQGFRIALDLNKLLLAAAGIMVMALGWWLLAWIFSISATKPEWKTGKAYNPATYGGLDDEEKEKRAWRDFKSDRKKWNLLHRAAGRADALEFIGAGDLAETPKEYDALTELAEKKTLTDEAVAAAAKKADVTDLARFRERVETLRAARADEEAKRLDSPYRKKAGELRTWPWFEDRGPNPYLLLTGQVPAWERGGFWDWLFRKQVPVLLEPLYKMVRPVILFFDADAGPLTSFYFLLVLLWTFVTWAIFGGAITRIAAVQIARQEKITLPEALRFTVRRWLSFVTAPVFPLLFVAFLVVFMIIYGAFYMIPYFGDIAVGGLFWWVMLFFGVLMAVALIGLVGWPLMYSTVSAEGTDSWEAVSRSYPGLRGAPRAVRRLHGLVRRLPEQVGRHPDADDRDLEPRAVAPVRLRPDVVRLAQPPAQGRAAGRRPARRR